MTITEEQMANRTFGCELEYEGISQATAAKTVAEVTGGTARYEGCHLSNWVVTMPDGRKWQVVSDGSLNGGAEVVTPILRWDDIETLQKAVRALRAKVLYDLDESRELRKSHENPAIKELYDSYLGAPGSHKAHETLHTSYVKRTIN